MSELTVNANDSGKDTMLMIVLGSQSVRLPLKKWFELGAGDFALPEKTDLKSGNLSTDSG